MDEQQMEQQQKQHQQNQEKLDDLIKNVESLKESNNIQFSKLRLELKEKLDPMYTVFTSVLGFNGVVVWIIKFLIGLGAAMGVIYGFIRWLKN